MRWRFAGWVIPCALVATCAMVGAEEAPNSPDFAKQVMPLFEAKCIRCHGAKKRGGDLDMRSLDAMLVGGVSGPALAPGNATKSLLIELIHFNEMPPKKQQPRVTKDELEMLRAWVDRLEK